MNINPVRNEKTAALLIACFYLVGIAGHLYSPTLPLMLRLTPLILSLFGILTLLQIGMEANGPLAAWAAVAYLVTFLLEVAGVATGLIFGSYSYGTTLGLSLAEVPLVIGFNWMIIVLGISSAVFRYIDGALPGALIAGAVAVLFDWVMEPVAIALDYWTWTGGDIPLQNYAAWFLIAACCAWVYRRLSIRVESRLGIVYVLIQLLFFAVLRIGGVAV